MQRLRPLLLPTRNTALRVALASLILCYSARAHGSPVGSIFAGTTAADPSSPYWNAAAMTRLRGTHIEVYGALSAIRVRYQRDTPSGFDHLPYPEADFSIANPDPMFGAVTDFGLRDFRFGVSLSIPWADGAAWAKTYDGRPASTRYHGLNSAVGQMMIGPAVAYEINRYISVGLGIDITALLVQHQFLVDYGARLNQLLCARLGATTCPIDAPLPREDPTYSGRAEINGFGWDVGVFGGLLVTPFPWLRLGVGVHSNAFDMTIPADIQVEVPPAVVEFARQNLPTLEPVPLFGEGEITFRSPIIVTAGIGLQPIERLEVAFDMHWMQLSRTAVVSGFVRRSNNSLLDEIVTVKGRHDHFLLALHGAYALLPDLLLGLRIELSTNARPEEFVTPTSVDTYKLSFHAGVIWDLTSWFGIIGEYGHYVLFSRDVRVSRFGPNAFPTTALEQGFDTTSPTGQYSADADRFGLGFRFRF